MHWKPEKLCSSHEKYDLLVERFKHGHHCEDQSESWKWRVIHSGVVLSQGTSTDMESAQKMAESNLPMDS